MNKTEFGGRQSVRPSPYPNVRKNDGVKGASRFHLTSSNLPPHVKQTFGKPPAAADEMGMGCLGNPLIVPETAQVVAAAPKYFRTNEQVNEAINALQAQYPNLVTVVDAGDSGDKVDGKGGHDIIGFRIGTPKPGEPKKPVFMVIAGEHAREIVNPEILMRKVSELLAGYGKNAEATALLDQVELAVLPIANPDGHAVVEKGYATQNGSMLMQRKNTRNGTGVDLNRNYPFKWGGPGASTNPRSDTYRGPSAGSEPETQAVINFGNIVKPDFFMTLHSYSELILYPWGDTNEKAPDYEGLRAFSDAMAFLTDEKGDKYTSQQAIALYPTSGTSEDHFYGTMHIPAVTIETGQTFHQSDAQMEETWGEISSVLDYAAKLSGDAYRLAKGPMVRSVAVDGARVQASVSDAYNGRDNIAKVEAVSDLSTPFGQGVELRPVDGAFDSAEEKVQGDVSSLKGKFVYVRAQDAKGNWGTWGVDWNKPSGQDVA